LRSRSRFYFCKTFITTISATNNYTSVYLKSIDERPPEIEAREEFGHWEGDGIVGEGQQGHLITLVEGKLGIGLLFNAGNRNQEKIVEIMDGLQIEYGKYFKDIFKSITLDNGSEFSDSTGIEKGGRTVAYYAHPYSSFKRGTNENWNGIVRRFIPKGSSFEKLTDMDMRRISHYINTLPRKRFGYSQTTLKAAHQSLLK